MSDATRSPGPKVGNADTQDMFRVSPWITYDPSPDVRNEPLVRSNVHFYNMNEDVDMDAPQISTLREEETPEPQPARTSKFRVKLLVNEGKRSGSLGSSASQKPIPTGSDEEEDDDEEEEDQLIDDDDEDLKPVPAAPVVPATAATRGSPAKRGRGRGGRRKASRTELPIAAAMQKPQGELLDVSVPSSSTSVVNPPAVKRKGRGGAAQRAIRKRPSKAAKAAIIMHRDDAESIMSEAYPATAASSPMPHDERTPELDISAPPTISAMTIEDGTLEGIPLPVYPLPSKPFPVQPPPKIGTGFAPMTPLDKNGKPVRRWRQVNREVRGIAGGRWFTRTWVGEKESEFASAQAAASQTVSQAAHAGADRDAASAAAMAAAGVVLPPKLAAAAALSAAASGKSTKSKVNKTEAVAPTIPSSRSDSLAAPESISAQLPRKRSNALGTPSSDPPVEPSPAL